ncbi:tripartite tricarboxylate transporter TctB family protein [Micromonospora sp. NPDC049679]|uniref:tripartite tricarboxylate transporter TctB family protein n=1 Tax=Micromonospora sp. NPDC049679 TaxID=3155920 RepID=UPI00340F00DD
MALSTRDTERAAPGGAALPRAPIGPRILGAVLLIVGLFLFWEAYRAADGDFSPQGPWIAPVVVTGGWVAVALWYLVKQFVSPDLPESTTVDRPESAVQTLAAAATADARADDAAAVAVPETERDPGVQWLPPALLTVALCGYLALLDPVGFVLASTLFFVAAARILGSRSLIRDVVVAIALALGIYLAFTHLLELHLPSGVLPL